MIEITSLEQFEELLKNRFEDSGGLFSLANLPNPKSFKDIEKSSLRVKKAIDKNEKIIIVGDYDVDGVVATAILVDFFKNVGVDVAWFIPNRFEHGYGISLNIIPFVQDYDLIISVDNGITATDFASWCQENGKDLIITDHHTPKELLPQAFAIINPKQEACNFAYSDICGAFVAWYFISNLKQYFDSSFNLKRYIPHLAIATIADVMPLLHINRAVVYAGLKELNRSTLPFVLALKNHLKVEEFTSQMIAYFVAPLLNSAGRMDDARVACEFLQSSNLYEAMKNLSFLVQTNEHRKQVESDIFLKAKEMIKSRQSGVIFAVGEEWHEGVLGIVASKLVQKYNKPAIVLTKTQEGLYKGSGRSVEGCNLFAILESNSSYLEKFGGHPMAIGLSIRDENIENFSNAIKDTKIENNKKQNRVVFKVAPSLINFALYNIIEKFEPYGEANQRPLFQIENAHIVSVTPIGRDQKHTKYQVEKETLKIEAIQFNSINTFNIGEQDIIFNIDKNSYRNQHKLQLILA